MADGNNQNKKSTVRGQDLARCYHRWLGIPPSEFPPPTHRLLGVGSQEKDKEVIRDAYIRQQQFVRRLLKTKHNQAAKRVLANLKRAESTLLKRAEASEPFPSSSNANNRGPTNRSAWKIACGTSWAQFSIGIALLVCVSIFKVSQLLFVTSPIEQVEVLEMPPAAPIFADDAVITIQEGQNWTFAPFVVNPAGPRDQLEFALGDSAPAGMAIFPRVGLISWQPKTSASPQRIDVPCFVTQQVSGRVANTTLTLNVVDSPTQMFVRGSTEANVDVDRQSIAPIRSTLESVEPTIPRATDEEDINALPAAVVAAAQPVLSLNDKTDIYQALTVPPKVNYGISSEGWLSISIPNLVYDPNQPLTMECWLFPELRHGGACIMGAKNGGPFMTTQWNQTTFGGFRNEGVVANLNWHKTTHVAMTLGEGFVTMFLDGKLVGQEEVTSGSFETAEDQAFVIGGMFQRNSGSTDRSFIGVIDEVRISNIARYRERFSPAVRLEADEHTIVLYHFDAAEGDTAYDSSGNNRHAKISSGEWVEFEDEALRSSRLPPNRDERVMQISTDFEDRAVWTHGQDNDPTLVQAISEDTVRIGRDGHRSLGITAAFPTDYALQELDVTITPLKPEHNKWRFAGLLFPNRSQLGANINKGVFTG